MIRDLLLLIVIAIIALAATVFLQEGDLGPVALLVGGLAIFYLERLLIGSSLSFSTLTVPAVFLFAFIVILCLGVVFAWDTFENEQAKYQYLLALMVTLIVFPLGVGAANVVSHSNVDPRADLRVSRFAASAGDEKFEDIFWIFLGLGLLIIVVFLVISPNVQLIDFLLQDPLAPDPDTVRFTQAELPKSMQYLFEIGRRVLLPVCMLYAFFMNHTKGGKWRLIFPSVLIAAFGVSLLTLDRSPPMGIIAMLGLAYFVTHRQGFMRWVVLGGLGATGIVVGGLISIFQYQISLAVSVDDVVEVSWYVATVRIFTSPAEMALRAFEAYNYDTHFLNGEYNRLLTFLFGGTYRESMSLDSDPLGAAPVTFVGDLWRNWGWMGVLSGAFGYGFVLQFLQNYIFRRMTVARGAVYVLLMLGSLALIHGNALGVVTLSVIVLAGAVGVAVSWAESKRSVLAVPLREA